MSGLAVVLAGREPSGVHRWESALDVDDVRGAVQAAGWGFAHLDGAAIETKAELLGALGQALELGPHYGRNLDALHDCLRDLSGPTVLLWEAWSGFARAQPDSFAQVLEVLGERDPGTPAVEVLLRGPGPHEAAPLLD